MGADGGAEALPRFFSWLVPGYLAGSSIPKDRQVIQALECLGVKLLVTAMDETRLPAEWFEGTQVRNVVYPVKNLGAPRVEEVDAFFKEVNDVTSSSSTAGIVVHCGGGVGRTAVFLACYLLRHGAQVGKPYCQSCRKLAARLNRVARSADCDGVSNCVNASQPATSPSEAIELLRALRPGSLETQWQEKFVKQYSSVLWSRCSKPGTDDEAVAAAVTGNNQLPLGMSGKPVPRPAFVVLIGLPGSGKSWLADELVKAGGWVRVSQDVEGSRESCEKMVSNYCKQLGKGKVVGVILDRCNPTAAERKAWLELAFKPRDAIAVYFDVGKDVCRQRISSRFGHESIRAGGGELAIAAISKQMQPPTLGEGYRAIFCVHNFENAQCLVEKWTGSNTTWEAGTSSSNGSSIEDRMKPVRSKAAEEPRAGKENGDKGQQKNRALTKGNATSSSERDTGAKKLAVSGVVKKKSSSSPEGSAKNTSQGETGITGGFVKKQQSSLPPDSARGPQEIIKFPRTPHLFNTGGAKCIPDDDIVTDATAAFKLFSDSGFSVHIQEKIDGANMGFSLNSDYNIVAQNRSHYISSKEQTQYGLLDFWVPQHKERLRSLLGNERNKRIVFGEWMVAKHAIQYTLLPDWFLAYDIYDIEKREFFSVARFQQAITECNLLEVEEEPVIYSIAAVKAGAGAATNKKQWEQLLMSCESAYRDGPVEGIYIRVDEGDRLKERLKLVRPDFVAGGERWSKHRITKNVVNLEGFLERASSR